MIIDCHTHSRNSSDAENDTVIERCERASQLGLAAMAVTDHCEVNRYFEKSHYKIDYKQKYDEYGFKNSFENSMAEISAAKEIYSGRVNLICGVEMGQPLSDIETAENILSDTRLDFVIGSIHELPGHDDFAFLDYSHENIPNLLEEYFNEIYKMCKWGKFDILGHLTYTLRYIQGEQNIKVDMKPYNEIIRHSFKALIQNGCGIEINTSGLYQKFGKTFPDFEYIKLYRELGGEIITVGSDSHSTANLARGIKEGLDLVFQAGFKRITYFKNRKPIFLNI